MMFTKSMLWVAAGAAALYAGMAMTRRNHQMRRQRIREEPVNRWEGEGGAVPIETNRTAAQVNPPPPESLDEQRASNDSSLER